MQHCGRQAGLLAFARPKNGRGELSGLETVWLAGHCIIATTKLPTYPPVAASLARPPPTPYHPALALSTTCSHCTASKHGRRYVHPSPLLLICMHTHTTASTPLAHSPARGNPRVSNTFLLLLARSLARPTDPLVAAPRSSLQSTWSSSRSSVPWSISVSSPRLPRLFHALRPQPFSVPLLHPRCFPIMASTICQSI